MKKGTLGLTKSQTLRLAILLTWLEFELNQRSTLEFILKSMVITRYLPIKTEGNTVLIDITSDCRKFVSETNLKNGIITVFNPGSTGALTTIEYDPNLIRDFKAALEVLAPSDKVYEHAKTWNDDNGSSHVRASFIGPSITIPFVERELVLGTWQEIVFCDFDTRSRSRRLVIQIIGE